MEHPALEAVAVTTDVSMELNSEHCALEMKKFKSK